MANGSLHQQQMSIAFHPLTFTEKDLMNLVF